APERSAHAIARIALSMTHETADTLPDAALESLRLAIPAARGLPLLQALTLDKARRVVLDYLGDMRLAVEVSPAEINPC
ncbi:MAG TPA: 3-oxoacyl-ACP synthase, partial [Methylophilaceae bacterium]|nr:3-oxoacyl-ACP synthase [Methylophilaceae bacterium]